MRTDRVIVVETPSRLRIDTGRLRIDREGQTAFISVEDIGLLLIDTPQVELTASVVQELSNADVAMIVTDARHYPAAILMPRHAHTHSVRRQRLQAGLAAPQAARLWAGTVSAKLRNQARFLAAQGRPSAIARLERMAESVQPGDPSNFEAQGAKLYWREVFKEAFKRSKRNAPDARNAALNFGYAILRGLLARYVSVAGLSPIFGFGHDNKENPYCLIDDLIEPYRPCVDALVATEIDLAEPFDSKAKRAMLKLLDCEALMGEGQDQQRFRLHAASYETVKTYVRALERDEELVDYPRGFVLPL